MRLKTGTAMWNLMMLLVAISAGLSEGESKVDPADRQASKEVRAMLEDLQNRKGKSLVSGQTDYPDAEWVKNRTGQTPTILGLDFHRAPKRAGGESQNIQVAIDWYQKRHGYVTFQWHWAAPFSPNMSNAFYTKNTKFNLREVLEKPESSEYQALITDIDDVASQLKVIEKAHVPILFRPLHEAQGAWFWWGASGAESCRTLYRLIYNRMTQVHHLHNLAWVWVAYPESNKKGDPRQWYPGDDCVDFVASDYCETKQDFDDLTSLTNGRKMVCLAETMNAPDPDRVLAATPWAYWVTWARRDWNKNSEPDILRAMANSKTNTLERRPGQK
jgi:mannan endo-1,4-beta-mannosidase